MDFTSIPMVSLIRFCPLYTGMSLYSELYKMVTFKAALNAVIALIDSQAEHIRYQCCWVDTFVLFSEFPVFHRAEKNVMILMSLRNL